MTNPPLPPIGVVGVGEIARAIVEGLSTGPTPPTICLSPRSADVAAALADRFENVSVAQDNQEVADQAVLLIIAVRPEQIETALSPLRLRTDTTVISVAAGIELSSLETLVPADTAVARAIPLSTVRSRDALTPVYPNLPEAVALFEDLGGALVTNDEAEFARFTALSSTVSAHLQYLATIADWGAQNGLDSDGADRFLRAVFAGVAESLQEDRSLAALAHDHETPGGYNEQFRTSWLDEATVRASLDALLRRATS